MRRLHDPQPFHHAPPLRAARAAVPVGERDRRAAVRDAVSLDAGDVMGKTVRERFEEKYIPVTESGCWLWLASTRNGCGYGQMHTDRNFKPKYAHRVSYELFKGPIPEGLQVLHICDVRICVNPDHLYVGDQVQNMQDVRQRGNPPWIQKRAKQYCKRGHPLFGRNLYVRPTGFRQCRICANMKHRIWKQSLKLTHGSTHPTASVSPASMSD